jgi:hypothetical protein
MTQGLLFGKKGITQKDLSIREAFGLVMRDLSSRDLSSRDQGVVLTVFMVAVSEGKVGPAMKKL